MWPLLVIKTQLFALEHETFTFDRIHILYMGIIQTYDMI